MKRKSIIVGSIIAIVLLMSVSLSNVVGYQSVKTSQEELIESEYDFEYCKDYLFETLVEISGNPEIRDIIKNNYKPQRTILTFRINNFDLKVEHLELLYEMGLKIIDRLGEEQVEELMENIEIEKPEYLDELDSIVMGNNELRERIYILNEMNAKYIRFWGFPIICGILEIIIALNEYWLFYFWEGLYIKISEMIPLDIIGYFFLLLMLPNFIIFFITFWPYILLCFEIY